MIDQVLCSDAIDFMASLDACSIDSIVTDPPHNLVFLGEDWDRKGEPQEYQDWCREWGEEAKRILKPGGYLLAAAATRTHHRLTSGLEDAGFSIRDCLLWLFGDGFPKNYSVSKGFDRRAFEEWLDALPHGLSEAEVREVVSAAVGGEYSPDLTTEHGVFYFEERGQKRPWYKAQRNGRATPGSQLLSSLTRRFWKPLPVEKRRRIWQEVVGDPDDGDLEFPPGVRIRLPEGETGIEEEESKAEDAPTPHTPELLPSNGVRTLSLTAPSTPLAKKWEGWGTALKPGWMPIVAAQKPCEGTFCHNVEKWGAGVLNIEACRIALPLHAPDGKTGSPGDRAAKGRWPANVCLDEEAAHQLDKQTGVLTSGKGLVRRRASSKNWSGSWRGTESQRVYGDSGGASRYFKNVKVDENDFSMYSAEKPGDRPECQKQSGMHGGISEKHKEDGIAGGESQEAVKSIARLKADGCGNGNMAQSLKDTKFITEMATIPIMPLRTCNSSPLNGMTTIISDCEKTTRTSKELSIGDASDVKCIGPSVSSRNEEQERTTDTVKIASGTISGNGEPKIESITTPICENTDDAKTRYFYCARASKAERTMQGKVNNPHKTVKPLELMRWLVRLVTPPGGIVLDPFCGSGTTLVAAREEGFHFLSCDVTPEYVEIAKDRLRLTVRKPTQLVLW